MMIRWVYPENITIITLLAYFVKVADDKSSLKALPFLMKADFDDKTAFSKSDYDAVPKKSTRKMSELLRDHTKPELPFYLGASFETYEAAFVTPILYRSDTCYRIDDKDIATFPDCGETSFRNVVTLFFSARKNGLVTNEAIDNLKMKLAEFNPGIELKNYPRFQKMITFFEKYNDMSLSGSSDAHRDWVNVVANLDEGDAIESPQSVRYGHSTNQNGEPTYEIIGNGRPLVKGLINMLNVVAKLIPDFVLNAAWSLDEKQRYTEAAEKLTRLCALFTQPKLVLSWKPKNVKQIESPFLSIDFSADDENAFIWRFLTSHFDIHMKRNPDDDWRNEVGKKVSFQNEWMAAVFHKNFDFENARSTVDPLALAYNPALTTSAGALVVMNAILHFDKKLDETRFSKKSHNSTR